MQAWTKYIVPKGYIAIDGTSLTVVDVTDTGMSVCLIPETLVCVPPPNEMLFLWLKGFRVGLVRP